MALPATDDFNRANADPIGGNWTTQTGASAWRVFGSSAYVSTGGSAPWCAYWNADSFNSDQYCQATGNEINNVPAGPSIRIQTGDSVVNCYQMCPRGSTTQRMFEYNSGTPTQLGADFSESITTASVIKIRGETSTLTFSVDGGDIGTRTDSTHTGGSAGLSASVDQGFDNWEAGNVSSGITIEVPTGPLR